MISPNAGKVLLGADGNPLLGAAGKIVLADSLYPMVPTQTVNQYSRTINTSGCPSSEIWSVSWAPRTVTPWIFTEKSRFYNGGVEETQCIQQFILENDSAIDWLRVKKLTCSGVTYRYSAYVTWVPRITKSKNNSSFSADQAIRNSWDAVSNVPPGVYPLSVEWVIDGVKPDSLEVALFFNEITCGNIDRTYRYDGPSAYLQPVRVVYNLAEPTP